MKNIKRFSILAAVLVLSLGILAACGGGGGDSADKTIKVAASPTPHAEVLNSISEALAEEGWTLEVVEFDVEDVIDDSFDPFDCAEMTSN